MPAPKGNVGITTSRTATQPGMKTHNSQAYGKLIGAKAKKTHRTYNLIRSETRSHMNFSIYKPPTHDQEQRLVFTSCFPANRDRNSPDEGPSANILDSKPTHHRTYDQGWMENRVFILTSASGKRQTHDQGQRIALFILKEIRRQ